MFKAIVQAVFDLPGRTSQRHPQCNARAAILPVTLLLTTLAVASMAPAGAQESANRVSPAERKDFVIEIQRQLKRLDCYAGPLDGRLDRPTLGAVERLRSAVGSAQFADYGLTSLGQRASTITENQFEAWVRRLRAINVRCQDAGAKREDAERKQTTEAVERLRREQSAGQSESSRRAYVAPNPVAPSAPSGGSRPPAAASAPRSSEATAPDVGAVDKSARLEPEAAAPPSAPAQPRVGATRGVSGRAARSGGATAAPTEPYDVVPIFYGTDRQRGSDTKRLQYGSERAKQLELGQALVTVPKLHQKPLVERPWVYKIPFTGITVWSEQEDPKKHLTIRSIGATSREDFIATVKQRLGNSKTFKDHALIFVHGFNTPFDFALYRAAQISYDLEFDGAMFAYSFPSRGEITLTSYNYDRASADQSAVFLEDFLKLVTRETGAKTVSIIAHSMGNQLLLPVLKDLQRMAPSDLKISQVILAAPDVDRDNFEVLAKQIAGVSKGFTLYAAANDRALMVSRSFWDGARAGDVPARTGPVVVEGIDTIDVTKTSTEIFSLGHNGFAEKAALLTDIRALILTGTRPPEKRTDVLEIERTRAGGVYWRYP